MMSLVKIAEGLVPAEETKDLSNSIELETLYEKELSVGSVNKWRLEFIWFIIIAMTDVFLKIFSL